MVRLAEALEAENGVKHAAVHIAICPDDCKVEIVGRARLFSQGFPPQSLRWLKSMRAG
jgi:hypothetical protein